MWSVTEADSVQGCAAAYEDVVVYAKIYDASHLSAWMYAQV